MITYKGKEVTKEWLIERIKKGEIALRDIKDIEVDKKKKKSTEKIEMPRAMKEYSFSHFIKFEKLKGRKLFGCVVRSSEGGLARISLDSPVPCYEHFMVEIPIECAEMEEQKVVKIIRRNQHVR